MRNVIVLLCFGSFFLVAGACERSRQATGDETDHLDDTEVFAGSPGAAALRDALQGAWVVPMWRDLGTGHSVSDAPWGARMIWQFDGERRRDDNGRVRVERELQILAPCLMRVSTERQDSHDSFAVIGPDLIDFSATGLVTSDGTHVVCDATLGRAFVGTTERCQAYARPSTGPASRGLSATDAATCAFVASDDGGVTLEVTRDGRTLPLALVREGDRLCRVRCRPPSSRHETHEAAAAAAASAPVP